jgi:TetR/AcrR family transcriptional regulator, transcriptional repressor of bet genes
MIEAAPAPVQTTGKRADNKLRYRQAIIEATLDTIAEHGISGTTVSRIVERAGVARGMVNLHFGSKEALLMEALRDLNQRYAEHFTAIFADRRSPPSARLMNYVDAELDPAIFNVRNMSVWFAFRGDRRSDPDYMPLIESRDPETLALLTGLFAGAGGKTAHDRAAKLAEGLMLLMEGIYADFHLHPDGFDRGKARDICAAFIEAALG